MQSTYEWEGGGGGNKQEIYKEKSAKVDKTWQEIGANERCSADPKSLILF